VFLAAAASVLRTTASRGCALQNTLDDGGGAAYSGIDSHGRERAIGLAGPAFDAGVAVSDAGLAIFQCENRMGTDGKTHAATVAAGLVKCQTDDVCQIAQAHFILPW
jgi:hypothetical protein